MIVKENTMLIHSKTYRNTSFYTIIGICMFLAGCTPCKFLDWNCTETTKSFEAFSQYYVVKNNKEWLEKAWVKNTPKLLMMIFITNA